MSGFVVELEEGVWLAAITGDPGRTLKLENATQYKSHEAASRALANARLFREFRVPKIYAMEGKS